MWAMLVGLMLPFGLAGLGYTWNWYAFSRLLTLLGGILLGNGLYIVYHDGNTNGWLPFWLGTLVILLDPLPRSWIFRA